MFMGDISDVNGFKTQLITWYKWGASLCVILMYPLIISQFAMDSGPVSSMIYLLTNDNFQHFQ